MRLLELIRDTRKTDDKTEASSEEKAYNEFFQEKFWSNMMMHGNVDICPTPFEQAHQNLISNWEYDAINLITNFVNKSNHMNDIEFTNTLDERRSWLKEAGGPDCNMEREAHLSRRRRIISAPIPKAELSWGTAM